MLNFYDDIICTPTHSLKCPFTIIMKTNMKTTPEAAAQGVAIIKVGQNQSQVNRQGTIPRDEEQAENEL